VSNYVLYLNDYRPCALMPNDSGKARIKARRAGRMLDRRYGMSPSPPNLVMDHADPEYPQLPCDC
jgi:hypothetical protein